MVANPSDLWGRIQECEKSQMRAEAEKNNLKEKINDLNSRLSELNNSLRDKERTIQDLNKKLVSVLASSLHIMYFYKLQWLQ